MKECLKFRIGDRILVNHLLYLNEEFLSIYSKGEYLTVCKIDEENDCLYVADEPYKNFALPASCCELEMVNILALTPLNNNKYKCEVIYTGTYASAIYYRKYLRDNGKYENSSLSFEQYWPPFLD